MDASQAGSIVVFWDFSRAWWLNSTTDPLSSVSSPPPQMNTPLVVLTPSAHCPSNSCDVTKGRLAKSKPRLPGYAIGWGWMHSFSSSHKLCCDWPFSVIFLKAWIASERNNSYWQIGWVGKGRGFELNASFLVASTLVWVKAYDEHCTIMII